ncbi:uncharacterized protein LOC126844744 [Adelges cooleyi]|uniref:uncharacterized protein LOC126844744 n=1 Tax=Adelges cooleyi TaxID=133065 RepID=UPI00218078CA|nr:uncharacterized protein LOC126844744 [Adelges cooleyi]
MFKNEEMLVDNWNGDDLMEIMKLPRVWEKLDIGIEIQELQLNRIDEVLNLIKENYIYEEPLMHGCQLYLDDESVEQYMYLSRFWIMDTMSTVAVDTETGKVVGFLICRFNELFNADDLYSKKRLYQGIGSKLLEVAMFKQLPEFEWFDTNVIVAIFTSKSSQDYAESMGMETLYEFMYAGWVSKNAWGEEVAFFSEMQPGNYVAKVMGRRVGPPLAIRSINDFESEMGSVDKPNGKHKGDQAKEEDEKVQDEAFERNE